MIYEIYISVGPPMKRVDAPPTTGGQGRQDMERDRIWTDIEGAACCPHPL